MSDNATPFSTSEYDEKIQKMMPYYCDFHSCAIDLVQTILPNTKTWLDTGCGTGSFALKSSLKFQDTDFYIADPSKRMLEIAEHNFIDNNINRYRAIEQITSELAFADNKFDIITAILSHHYSDKDSRKQATANCFRMLKPNGVYITFENILPLSSFGTEVAMKRWFNFKLNRGESLDNEKNHYSRLGTEYFPITILEHLALLKSCGFIKTELFWMSYMQAGFFAIKP